MITEHDCIGMDLKMIARSPYEAENGIETSLREAFSSLEPNLRPPFPLTIPTQELYLNLNRAILYGILCEPTKCEVHLKHLHGVVTDGFEYFTSMLVRVVNKLYGKLVDYVKRQLIWVTEKMVSVSAVGIDGLLVALLRQIVGGDYSKENLWLRAEMVYLFKSNWEYILEDNPMVLTGALYVFLRLLADRSRVVNEAKIVFLREMEIAFCTRMLRERFSLCLMIGRDLVRLLQDLVNIPEFRAIWKDLLYNPSTFSTEGFVDISQIYRSRTRTWYFLLRLTPEMETQLRFLLTHVKFGCQKRYQDWFSKKFLATNDTSPVIIDIVRFICCAHHPSADINSGIIPRWAVIGWLLLSDTRVYVQANLKLALFYDWLFFDEKVDNFINIEPAILLMTNSIPRYMNITHSLIDFLLILLDNYDLERKDMLLRGISTAFHTLIRHGVIRSLDILINSDMLSPILKRKLEKLLPDMFVQDEKFHKSGIPPAIMPFSSSSLES